MCNEHNWWNNHVFVIFGSFLYFDTSLKSKRNDRKAIPFFFLFSCSCGECKLLHRDENWTKKSEISFSIFVTFETRRKYVQNPKNSISGLTLRRGFYLVFSNWIGWMQTTSLHDGTDTVLRFSLCFHISWFKLSPAVMILCIKWICLAHSIFTLRPSKKFTTLLIKIYNFKLRFFNRRPLLLGSMHTAKRRHIRTITN